MRGDRAQLLLVEDNAADVRLLREAMREARTPNDVLIAGDGEQALEALTGRVDLPGTGRVDIVLLDLNLPRKSGLELLAELRSDVKLRSTPVIILSTSTSQADIDRAYDLGANCYIVKPVDFDQFRSVVAAIDHFWFGVVHLPGINDSVRQTP